uniref:late embryogenesis abundant protein At5g17165-like n=1 Tax=Erigeron canadensis TaxID=72917 RepID=UPI001CB9067C|nr:late embryogenesis abundant protein At5g17165-like [Erigeron canadensis]
MAAAGGSKLIMIRNNHHLRTLTTTRPTSFSSTCSAYRRKVHESANYEKEVEEEVVESFPIEDISHKPEEYWEPDPKTGVFVPAAEQNLEEPAVTCTTEETVLDEKAFIRPDEDLEPPVVESFTGEIPPVDPFAD